jgi:hypothetical protein
VVPSTVCWENANKEAWWRLTVDGIPLLENSHVGGTLTQTASLLGMPGSSVMADQLSITISHFKGGGVAGPAPGRS